MEDLVVTAVPNVLADDLDHVLAHTAGLWDELRGARLFISGGTGFFGCWLLETFVAANDRLRLDATIAVLTRNREAFTRKAPHLAGHPAVRLCDGDVLTLDHPAASSRGRDMFDQVSHVIHAATETRTPASGDERRLAFDTTIEGTRRMLEHSVRCGARRFLLTSTGAIYGRQPPELTHLPEEFAGGPDPASPDKAGAEAKRAAESLGALYADAGIGVTIARCFAFVGPYLPLGAQYAAGNFIRDGLAGGPIQVSGDGTPYRSYLYAADLAIWLWTILLRGEPLRPYNVGSEEPIAIRALAHHVARQFDPEPGVTVRHSADPHRPAERYVPRTARIRSELGVAQTIGLDEALRRTVAWHQQRAAEGHVR